MNNDNRTGSDKVWLIGLALAAALVILLPLLSVGVYILFSGDSVDRMTFNADEWRRVGESDIRQTMVDDYLQNHSPVGLTREEVIHQLGEPPDTDYFRDYDLVYRVGTARGPFAMDSEWLVLRLDDHDKVIEARLVED